MSRSLSMDIHCLCLQRNCLKPLLHVRALAVEDSHIIALRMSIRLSSSRSSPERAHRLQALSICTVSAGKARHHMHRQDDRHFFVQSTLVVVHDSATTLRQTNDIRARGVCSKKHNARSALDSIKACVQGFTRALRQALCDAAKFRLARLTTSAGPALTSARLVIVRLIQQSHMISA